MKLPSAKASKKMSWLTSYCLDFGFCFNYPKDFWFNYFATLKEYGYNGVMLWVAGILPVEKFEDTLAWRCEYVPEIVDYLHSIGMRVYLMSGVFGWLGMSPGLIKMYPEIEITWSDELKKKFPLDSTRRGICPSRGFDICLEYIESLYQAVPSADGMCLEVFCEKPHCQCSDCQNRGLWKIELEFLNQISNRLWSINPDCEIIWPVGYNTHREAPESKLYSEIAKLKEDRFIWWQVRMYEEYFDEEGNRHRWRDRDVLSKLGRNLLVFITQEPNDVKLLREVGGLGITTADPNVRYLFLPNVDPRHFGYFVEAPPAEPYLYNHLLFHLRGYRRMTQFADENWSEDRFIHQVADKFFDEYSGDERLKISSYAVQIEKMILDDRVCMFRSAERVWGDIDGGEVVRVKELTRAKISLLKQVVKIEPKNKWAVELVEVAKGLIQIVG